MRAYSFRYAALAAFTLGCAATSACASDGSAETEQRQHSRSTTDSIARARRDSIVRSQPGYVVDSAIPIAEALRRFRAGISDTPTVLVGGAWSRSGLVTAFARAVERGDTVALRRMTLTRAEFAFLVYPSSQYTGPPYRQQPEIVWLLLSATSEKGLRRLVERRAGIPFGLVGHDCPAIAAAEGDNRLWRGCRVRRTRDAGGPATERLFGPIIERHGRFKFYSYGNEL